MDPKQRFYRHFRDSVAVLQDQIGQLPSFSAVAGERQDAIDHILAGLSKLQNEVADTADDTPSYDRRQYSETIKGLQDRLKETLRKINPKARFQFRRTSSGTAHVDMGAPENDPRLHPGSLSTSPQSHVVEPSMKAAIGVDKVGDLPNTRPARDYNDELSKPGTAGVRKPSFSMAQNIGISHQRGLHIILPSSAAHATASGSLVGLSHCIVDMSVPTSQGRPFPGLALRDIERCLIIAGRVNGPIHITNVSDSVLVVVARQVRIHECRNVDIYLHCGNHPIIEDCTGMRFAPLPKYFMRDDDQTTKNQWDQVDDFKWLKAGHSPNWTILSEAERLSDDDVWASLAAGQPGASVHETLSRAGILRN